MPVGRVCRFEGVGFDVIQAPTAFKAERTDDASPHFRFWHIASESRHALPVSVAIGPETDFGCARRQCCPVQVAGPPDRMPPIEPWGANMRRRRARSVGKRGIKIVHRILIGLFVAFMALPASAQSSNRNWVKAGTEGSFVLCVDQNSISKRADGLTQFVTQLFCRGPEATMRVEAVKCEQDMSGQHFPMQGRPFSPDDDG
jgi:hypothetical protein